MQRTLGYRPALDGVRAVAIALVLLNHTGLRIFEGGGNGVIVFFVLSGFLITKLMLEESDRTGTISVGAFYGRRAVRILPAPTVMLAVLLALSWYITETPSEHSYLLKEIGLAATYLTNMKPLILEGVKVNGQIYDGFLGHMWSLAVEEQFYLVWPLTMIALALPTRNGRRLIKVVVGVAVAIAAARLAVYYLPQLDPDLASISLFSFDGFALGAALAFLVHRESFPAVEQWLARPWVPLVGLAVLGIDLVAGRYTHQVSSLYVVYCSIAAAMIIGHLFVAPESTWSTLGSHRAMVLVGKWSYSIYLWHNPIWVFISRDRYPGTSIVVLTLAEWGLTLVAVLVSYYAIEKPAMRLRKRFAH